MRHVIQRSGGTKSVRPPDSSAAATSMPRSPCSSRGPKIEDGRLCRFNADASTRLES